MNARMPMLAGTAALVAAILLPLALPAQAADQDSLIPRKDIFGNPTRTLPAISPDGKNIAYIAPRDGVLNVFVAPRDNIGAAKPITADRKRGIRAFFWARTAISSSTRRTRAATKTGAFTSSTSQPRRTRSYRPQAKSRGR